jgi:ubiquinone/menaquinone biosynthesis C-methylase UbiE
MARSKAPDLKVFMNYDYPVDFKSDTAAAAVIRFIRPGSRVLEIGAGSGAIARHLVEHNQCDLVALENNPASVKKLNKFCSSVHNLDLNDETWPDKLLASAKLEGEAAKFDYVLAADVLEHLYDPWTVLKSMKRMLNDNGRVILSLPHASHSSVLTAFYNGDVQMNEWGLLDKTHIRFFGLKNIDGLYESAGMSVVNVHYVLRHPEETEFAEHFRGLPPDVQNAFNRRGMSDIYQVVSEAMPTEKAVKPIVLEHHLPKSDGVPTKRPTLFRRIFKR